MEFIGRLTGGIRIDLDSRKMEFTVQSDSDKIAAEWEELRQKELLTIIVKPYRKKRSLDANAYYWQLLTKLAGKLKLSKPHLHNLLLRRYGQPEVIDGKMIYLVLPDSEAGEEKANEAETYHIRPTSQVKEGDDGRVYRTYVMLRGSSTYDTAEMSILIDGLVEECKGQGIETLPPEELKQMMQAYEMKMMQAYEMNWRKRHEEA